MFRHLKQAVLDANLRLSESGLVISTFGNVSAVDRDQNVVAIKPSGVPYRDLTCDDIVITDLAGTRVDGCLSPSSDLQTHLVLYRQFPQIGAVVHTHSEYATTWAQAKRPIPPLGTTHADYFFGPVPVTEELTRAEIDGDYVTNTGQAIARIIGNRDPYEVPAILVFDHGPFCWGRTAEAAVDNAIILETVARLAYRTHALAPDAAPVSAPLLRRHFFRKHGAEASYGQATLKGKAT